MSRRPRSLHSRAGSEIGEATAVILAERGAKVVLGGRGLAGWPSLEEEANV